MSRRYEDLTGPEIHDRINPDSILLLPIGAVEQHGPHLPLAVDHVIAHETATALTDRVGDELDIWQLPTMSIGKSNEHLAYPGPLTFETTTLLAAWTELGESVRRAGVRKLVMVNAHGGQPQVMEIVARELRVRHAMLAVASS